MPGKCSGAYDTGIFTEGGKAYLRRLDEMDEIEPVKDWSVGVSGGPRSTDVGAECGIITEKSEVGVE